MNSVPEIRRERIIIPAEMTKGEVKKKYGLSTRRAREALNKGFFVKNYSKRQVIIDPDNFDPLVSYSTAKRVYFKNFSWRPVAQTIKEDLIQEAGAGTHLSYLRNLNRGDIHAERAWRHQIKNFKPESRESLDPL